MGKFATQDDVTGRFEGSIPSGRLAWVDLRIGDVEQALMGQVPSLRKTLQEIEDESVAAGDPDRLARVTTLVADKVLELYRHPTGENQLSRGTPDVTISRSWSPSSTRGRVAFTDDELGAVRLRGRKSRFGSFFVAPWRITTCD